jgi:hypothetical protein
MLFDVYLIKNIFFVGFAEFLVASAIIAAYTNILHLKIFNRQKVDL